MSLGTCLADLLQRKLISQDRHDRLKPVYDGLVAQYEGRYGRAAAESMATEKALALADDDALQRKRTTLLQAQAQGRIYQQAKLYRGGIFADGPITRQGLLAHLVKDQNYGGIKNVELQGRMLLDDAHRLNWDLLARFRHDLLGRVRHKADLLPLAQALHGEAIDDVNITELAKAASETNEWFRSRFNAAGGHIGQLDGFGVPHNWDAYRVGALTAEQFIDIFAPELDRGRMIDYATGEPLSDEKLPDVLRQVYDSITSSGANKATPGQPGGSAWSSRWADHRVLHFKDAEAWSRINDRFGTGTVIDALHSHWNRMANAIGAMEVLGPNPAATIRWMQDVLDQEAKVKGTAADRAKASVGEYEIGKVWDELTGQSRKAVRPNFALFMSSVRHWETAARLGFSVISALSDHATRATTNLMNGLPIALEMGRYFRQLNPLDPATREWARRNLIVSQELAGRMGGFGRMTLDDSYGGRLRPSRWDGRGMLQAANEVTRRMSDAAMRLSVLTGHTVAAREAGAYQFVANISHHARDGWANLDGDFRAMMERHGIGAGDWEQIRATPMRDWQGKGWIVPDDIADRELRERVRRAQFLELDLGTPTGGVRQAAMMRIGRPGTVGGELVAGAAQFKMFPVVVVAEHAQRWMSVPTKMGRTKYAAAFFGSTLMMGALAQQLYELAHGRDPLPMDTGDFWRQAAARSGGAGVYGDAINLSRNEFGQSLSDMTGGPQLTTAQNIASETWALAGLGTAAITSEADMAKARLTWAKANRNLLRRETPVLNNWYTNAAYERLLVDTLTEMSAGDPNAVQRSYAATEQYARDRGTQYWAPPGGGAAGMRAPDLGNVLGGGTQEAPAPE